MSGKIPGLFRTYWLANRNPAQLFRETGLQDTVKVRRRGLQTVVTLTHPDHIRHVLVKRNDNYVKAPSLRLMWQPYLGEGLLTSSGDHWQKIRKTVSPAFHHKMMNHYAAQTVAECQKMIKDWHQKVSRQETVSLAADFAHLSLSIINKTVLQNVMTSEEVQNFIGNLNKIDSETRLRDLGGLNPYFSNKPAGKRQETIDAVNTAAHKALETRKNNPETLPDVLQLLLDYRDPHTDALLSDDVLYDEIKTLFLSGFETTAIIMSWSLYLLGKKPDICKKIQKTLPDIPDNRPLGFTDLKVLDLLSSYVEEVMRYYPPGPLLSRVAEEEDVIDGVKIPAGCLVEMNVWQTHRHPDFWEKPDQFIPERFLEGALSGQHKQSYLPFSSGPRSCIGKPLAMMEILLCLAMILKTFDLQPISHTLPCFKGAFVMRPDSALDVILRQR